ncbi:TetR/AcrR family transcriptional regulator [Humidisolicoccus flavus]|uniref:TetR/AcrR family transcriptional regulator n=1 Tax=Humidisolicoccus flavus TaxID=3111414 RepID=UPI0032549656
MTESISESAVDDEQVEAPSTTADADLPELPHAVALAWGIAELPHRGRKRELSIERIVEAAVEIADAEGLHAVSMARVANALGFTTMSLYRHVTSKEELLLLMFDKANDFPIPVTGGTWREQLREWARVVHAGYRAHPWMADMPPAQTPTTPNRFAVTDAALRAMRELRIPDESKIAITLLLLGYVGLFGLAGRESAVDSQVRAALPLLVTQERFPDLAKIVAEGVFATTPTDSDREFFFGLARLLDGIEAWSQRAELEEELAVALPPAVLKDKQVKEANKVVRELEERLATAERRQAKIVEKVTARELEVEQRRAAKIQKKSAKRAERIDERDAKREISDS